MFTKITEQQNSIIMARSYQTKYNLHIDTLSACYDSQEGFYKWLLDTTAYNPLPSLDPKEKERKTYTAIIEINPTLYLQFTRSKEDKEPHELKASMYFANNYFCGTWLFTNSKLYSKRAWFTASNFMLYHEIPTWGSEAGLEYPATLIDLIEMVAEHFNLTFHNITDLHLALDTNKNVERAVRSMLTDCENFDLYLRGQQITDENEIFENVFECARRSRKRIYKPSLTIQNEGVRVQCYDKSFEQETQGNNKPYIAEVNGFKNMHRIEVRMRNKDFEKVFNRYLRMTERERKKEFNKMGLEFKPCTMSDVNVLRMLENPQVLTFMWRYLTDKTIYFADKEGNVITLYDLATI